MTTNKRQVAKPRAVKNGIIGGINHGFATTPIAKTLSRHVALSKQHKRLRAVKAVIADLVGFTPLDKRVVELLRVGKEKRAVKLCKKRLGSITAAKKRKTKVEDALRAAQTTKKK
jgi:large subunit ribosomal protein L36e